MKVVIDIETNSLVKPSKLWCIVAKSVDGDRTWRWRNLTENDDEKSSFLSFAEEVTHWIGHNIVGYDGPVLHALIGYHIPVDRITDTYIISKLIDYPRNGHSIESYGLEFGIEKGKVHDFKQWSQELEDYCERDVEICLAIYNKYLRYISNPDSRRSIELEHKFEQIAGNIHRNGFGFDIAKAEKLLDKVNKELEILDKDILDAFPPRLKPIRVVTPQETKYGTLNRKDFRFVTDGDLSDYNGGPFTRCSWAPFNPASHKQIIEVLNRAKWKPVDKTQSHIDTEREYNRLKLPGRGNRLDLAVVSDKLLRLRQTGWKVNETNLDTLPPRAPAPARSLAKRILYESRRRTLTEWLGLVNPDTGRIHGKLYAIGTWTHRTSTQAPNLQNIPNEFDISGKRKLLGKELRALWIASKNRLLAGVDAEGIQLRIFAHLIDDLEFTKALVEGNKEDKSDPHSLNQRIIGPVCKTRAAAKRFIYALLLGGSLQKLSDILECSVEEAREALSNVMGRYTGFATLKESSLPRDGKRGWFFGLDGRKVRLPGDTVGDRRHLAMSGYLQNGEAVVMKLATTKFEPKLKDYDALLVDLIHDEWQVECPNDFSVAKEIAELMCRSLVEAGEELNLKCPLAGSYWNDDVKDFTIGTNWAQTH